MKRLLPFALLALPVVANAAPLPVTYHAFDDSSFWDFTVTAPDFVTTMYEVFDDSQFDAQSGLFHVEEATFYPGGDHIDFYYHDSNFGGDIPLAYFFDMGAFGAVGTYRDTLNGATLTVTQAVPEPASLAALGLGALAIVRRRKGAR